MDGDGCIPQYISGYLDVMLANIRTRRVKYLNDF